MKYRARLLSLTLAFFFFGIQLALAAESIVIGVPTSLGFLEGKESHKAVQIAVEEIKAKGLLNKL